MLISVTIPVLGDVLPKWAESEILKSHLGDALPKGSCGCQEDSLPQAVGLKASVLHWLLARGLPQLLATRPFPVGSVLHQSKRTRRQESVQARRKPRSLVSHPFCHILFLRFESLGPAYTPGKELYTRAWIPGGGRDPRAILGSYLPHQLKPRL